MLVSNISILYMINRSPRIAVVSTDQLCFPEQSGRVNRSNRPFCKAQTFKAGGGGGVKQAKRVGAVGVSSCLVCDFLVRRVAFTNAQLSSGTHRRLWSYGHAHELGLRFDMWANGLIMWRGANRISGLTSLASMRSTGDTRPNPATFATDSHDALASIATH